MNFFRYDMKISFRCTAVPFHFFITKTIVPKYYRIRGKPAFIIIYIEFIIRFINDQVDSTYRKYFPVPCYNSLFGFCRKLVRVECECLWKTGCFQEIGT